MRTINLSYKPYLFADRKHAVEKSIDGQKHRYLCGVASGSKMDAVGDLMTPECVQYFHEQATIKNVLLFTDVHGIAETQDIGILTKSEILGSGDWYVEFRLYDESDGIGQAKLDTIDTLWKQVNGLPPYPKPMQKGFSIEGFAREDEGDVKVNPLTGKKVFHRVNLKGAVVVPDPAYASVATAIYKSLEMNPPWVINAFKSMISTDELSNTYYKQHYKYQDALEDEIERIMTRGEVNNKLEALRTLFSEYSQTMIDLVLQSSAMFEKTGRTSQAEDIRYLYNTPVTKNVAVLKSMLSIADRLIMSLQKNERGNTDVTRCQKSSTADEGQPRTA